MIAEISIANEGATERGFRVRPDRKPGEGLCGYTLRLADENRVSFNDVLALESALAALLARKGSAECPSAAPRLVRVSRFCPRCLAASGYCQEAWELPLADACVSCGHWLVDRCSSCGKHLLWKRRRLLLCDCGASLIQETSKEAPQAVVALSRTIAALSRGGEKVEIPTLAGLNVEECLRVCNFIAAVVGRVPYKNSRSLEAFETLELSWNVSTLAAEALLDWPNSIIQGLRQWNERAPESARGSLRGVFGTVYEALNYSLAGPKFEFLAKAFGSYVVEFWTGAVAKRNREGVAVLADQLAWIPVAVAARRLGMTAKQVRSMAARGEIPSHTRMTETGRRFVVVSSKYVRENSGLLKSGYNLQEASKILGMGEARVRDLACALLPDMREPVWHGAWTIPSSWIDALMERFRQAPLAPEDLGIKTSTLRQALRGKLSRSQAALGAIKSILGGKLQRCWRPRKSTRFSDLILDWEDICAWERAAAAVGPTAIALPNAARRMRVKEEVVYSLVRSGLLQTTIDRCRQRPTRYTNQQWIDQFQSTFVFGRDLAAELGRSPKFLAQWLLCEGVLPVAGPGVDGCRQLVYRAEEVERVIPVNQSKQARVQTARLATRTASGEEMILAAKSYALSRRRAGRRCSSEVEDLASATVV